MAADLASARARVDGVFFLGSPLPVSGTPETVQAEQLYRLISPMLFVQGTRDRRCDGAALRSTLRRVGAPIELHDVADADSNFHAPKKSGRTDQEIQAEIIGVVAGWIARRLA